MVEPTGWCGRIIGCIRKLATDSCSEGEFQDRHVLIHMVASSSRLRITCIERREAESNMLRVQQAVWQTRTYSQLAKN